MWIFCQGQILLSYSKLIFPGRRRRSDCSEFGRGVVAEVDEQVFVENLHLQFNKGGNERTVERGDQYHENSRTMQARSCLRKLLIWLHSVLFTNQLGTLVSLAQCNFPRTKGLEFLVQLRIVSKARDETFTLCQETWFRPWPWLVSPRGCSKICSSYCGALCKYTTGNKQNKQARKSERRFQRNFLSLRKECESST